MKTIYLDHAATTPTDREVVAAMTPYFTDKFGNPSTLYGVGREAKAAIEEAREKVASLLGADPGEVFFTSGGTESDNQALVGIVYANEKKGNHLITCAIEHHAVLDTAEFLKRRGFEATILPVDKYGMVDPEDVRRAINGKTVLVSIMHANNEVGTVQPVAEIGKIAREAGVAFHTDAVQTFGHLPIDVNAMKIDLLSISGHKLYGPKGVGAIYIRKGTRIIPFMHGGGQESRRRAGTHNVPGIVGLGKAAEIAAVEMGSEEAHLSILRDELIASILERVEDVRLNGHPTERLPNNINVCIEGAEGEAMLLSLDMEGICVSSGSACTSGTLNPSHVLLAMGIPAEIAHGSLRVTLGRSTTKKEIDYLLEVLPPIVERLRKMSPLKRTR
ncbi:MAG: cysteine desulfurase NifS [Actinobacteria bacterium]|nr:cysteine desulfurase NifS [Actinomycetota bacterium]